MALAYFFFIFASAQIIDHYAFRQTQVATVARELARGGPLLAYYMPVFGPPWSAPFEFPLYQLVVAGVSNLTGLGIEKSGRLVGLFSGTMALAAVVRLTQVFDLPRKTQVVAVVLVGGSPIFFYWSQAVMIEVFTLALSLWMTVAAAEFVKRGRVWPLSFGVLCAIGAAMAKATTFAIFAIVIFLMFAAVWIVRSYRNRQAPIEVVKTTAGWFLYGVILFVPALLLAFWYIDYGDAIKAASPLTQALTSENLRGWNHGNPEQLKKALSYIVLPFRDNGPAVFQQALGLGWIALVSLAFAGYAFNPRRLVSSLVLACGFFAGPAIFSNLYEVHYYYWIANILFAIGFILLGVSSGLEFLARRFGNQLSNLLAASLCVAYLGGSFPVLHNFFLSATVKNSRSLETVAKAVQAVTEPDGIIYVFGYDWDPAVQYYADRFAMMGWDPKATLAYGAKHNIDAAAVLFCRNEKDPRTIARRLSAAPLNEHAWVPANTDADLCQVFHPSDVRPAGVSLSMGLEACSLYMKALYTDAKVAPSETCAPTIQSDRILLTTTHGRRLEFLEIGPGESASISAANLWHRSRLVDATGAWENPGLGLIVRGAVAHCLEVTTIAADANSDSLFLLRNGDEEPHMVSVPVDAGKLRTTVLYQTTAPAGADAIFFLYAREPRIELKSVRLVRCA